MQKLLIAVLIVVAAVVLPTVSSPAQPADGLDCRRGVVVGGHCVSVDGLASTCEGDDPCIGFGSESVNICPAGTTALEPDPLQGLVCERVELAAQRDPSCPEGSRGETGACFIYRGIGPDGCFAPAVLDQTSNCRQAVNDAPGSLFCERDDAELVIADCVSTADPIPSPCPATTTRFDGACWQLNGLSPPESCGGHLVDGTIELDSGFCQVPLDIPSGPTTCVDPAAYREHPGFILISQVGEVQGEGPVLVACVDDSVSIGLGVAHCFFLDDDLAWGDSGDPGLCTLFESPVTVTCPSGYTIDDSAAGTCWRFERPTDSGCPVDGIVLGAWCAFTADFASFVCPGETTRHPEFTSCVAYRTWQGAASCGGPTLLLPNEDREFGLPLGCFAHVGPQPDQCNGLGTLDACFEIREPAATTCPTASGCVRTGDFRIPGDVSCDGAVSLLDALMIAQHAVAARAAADRCEGLASATELFAYDGDLDADQAVGNSDALLVLECAAGFQAFDGC